MPRSNPFNLVRSSWNFYYRYFKTSSTGVIGRFRFLSTHPDLWVLRARTPILSITFTYFLIKTKAKWDFGKSSKPSLRYSPRCQNKILTPIGQTLIESYSSKIRSYKKRRFPNKRVKHHYDLQIYLYFVAYFLFISNVGTTCYRYFIHNKSTYKKLVHFICNSSVYTNFAVAVVERTVENLLNDE